MRRHTAVSVGGIATALAVALVGGAATATLQQGGDGALVDRLVELERQLPALPPDAPGDVTVVVDQTWGDVSGDFFGASVALDGLAEQARDLFVDADEAGDDTADAVADAARAVLDLRQAYQHLAAWESHDLSLAVGTPAGTDASTFADERYGRAATGLDLLERAHQRRVGAYRVLRDAAAASDEAKNHFDVQFQAERAFAADVLPRIRRVVSARTTRLLVTTGRFRSATPGDEARARSMTVACVDRDAYTAVRDSAAALVAGGALAQPELPEQIAGLLAVPATDCPDLPPETTVRAAP